MYNNFHLDKIIKIDDTLSNHIHIWCEIKKLGRDFI